MNRSHSLSLKVRKTIEKFRLVSPGDTVVVAVSGGIDSMVLLDILASLKDFSLRLVVAHLNHLLRGGDSARDENFVREAAAQYELPCAVERADVRELARTEKRSLEEAGREARYRFLERVVRKEGAACCALAHHADDQAETVLMRLLRGAGTGGLSGISPRSAGWKVRPLIEAARREIEEYAVWRRIAHREDASNSDRRFLRNRVRHELLPILGTYNPAIARALAATAAIQSAEDELLSHLTDTIYQRCSVRSGGEVVFPLHALHAEPVALRLRLYRQAINEVKGDLLSIASSHLWAVDELIEPGGPSRTIHLPSGVRFGNSYDILRVYRESDAPVADAEVTVNGFGRYEFADWTVVVSPAPLPFRGERLPVDRAVFDLERAPFPWTLRPFRNGDRIVPFGMVGTRKVKELFGDRKVPRHLRRRRPLLCDAQGSLLWICGLRRSSLAPVSAVTRRAVVVEIVAAVSSKGDT